MGLLVPLTQSQFVLFWRFIGSSQFNLRLFFLNMQEQQHESAWACCVFLYVLSFSCPGFLQDIDDFSHLGLAGWVAVAQQTLTGRSSDGIPERV